MAGDGLRPPEGADVLFKNISTTKENGMVPVETDMRVDGRVNRESFRGNYGAARDRASTWVPTGSPAWAPITGHFTLKRKKTG